MARTIPRYLPALDLRARLAAFGGQDEVRGHDQVRSLLGLDGWPLLLPVQSARAAIAGYFSDLAQRSPKRTVLVSAQICPIVPKILAELGFHLAVVDVEEDVPVPGGQRMLEAFTECNGAGGLAAVLVAPIYGYLPTDIDLLAGALGEVPLVLDLAQGALLARQSPLTARADAAIFSFSPGKGVDIGGGLLALRRPLASGVTGRVSAWLPALATLPATLALSALATTGLYRFAVPLINRVVEEGKDDPAAAIAAIGTVLSGGVFSAFAARLTRFTAEVELARERAGRLAALPAVARATLHGALFDRTAMHLRQIVRLDAPQRRDDVLHRLRAAGIDVMPAGEPLPDSYLAPERLTVPPSSAGLPNARRFRADAIRLPFLGRLADTDFARLASALETALDQRL